MLTFMDKKIEKVEINVGFNIIELTPFFSIFKDKNVINDEMYDKIYLFGNKLLYLILQEKFDVNKIKIYGVYDNDERKVKVELFVNDLFENEDELADFILLKSIFESVDNIVNSHEISKANKQKKVVNILNNVIDILKKYDYEIDVDSIYFIYFCFTVIIELLNSVNNVIITFMSDIALMVENNSKEEVKNSKSDDEMFNILFQKYIDTLNDNNDDDNFVLN